MDMTLEEFLSQRYIAAADTQPKTMIDGSILVRHKKDNYIFENNYWDGNPRIGREMVLLDYRPVWLMNHMQEIIHSGLEKEIQHFLGRVLKNSPINLPIRGPEEIIESEDLRYQAIINGNISEFSAVENIWYKKYEQVYRGTFHGCKISTNGSQTGILFNILRKPTTSSQTN
jgi:hypothetical protein